jgi:hypothetical protein
MKNEEMNRRQRRYNERVNAEVKQVIDELAEKFLKHVVTSDNPDGEETTEKVKQFSSQWRLYCKRKALVPKAYILMDEIMAGILNDYKNPVSLPEENIVQP